MKKNIRVLKVILQVCFLCPTILHQIKKNPQAQSVVQHQRSYKTGTCEKSTPEKKALIRQALHAQHNKKAKVNS